MTKECTTHHHACDCRESKFAELEQQLAEAQADTRKHLDTVINQNSELLVLRAQLADLKCDMVKRERYHKEQLAELKGKLADYEYPLRTKETVTVPVEVWDAREAELAELRGLQDKLEEVYPVVAAHIKRLLEEGK